MSDTAMTDFERELLSKLIAELDLEEDVVIDEVDRNAPLYGYDNEGLGLDSIDFLEVAVMLSKHYGVEIKEGGDNNREIFANLQSLASYVSEHRSK